ncbi:MAG TPA: hypothetical protein PKE62_05485 [Anaerolineales bacterium]|nr:hypothetical protein [Anaerolineales bacterium]
MKSSAEIESVNQAKPSAHLAEALHATQSSEVDDGNGVMGRLSPHK